VTLFERIDQHKTLYGYLAFFAYVFINNTINASSNWMEQNRDGLPTTAMWEPFVWEYTSALSTLMLLPILLWLFNRNPPKFKNIRKQLCIHLFSSIIFSLLHVMLMVTFREWIYLLNNQTYDFGPWHRELWYEYRKDAWGYAFIFGLYHMIQFIYARLKGEASPVAEDEDEESIIENSPLPSHFLVKKLDKEFLVKVTDIEWIESSGNYVNLHSKGRIYPLRSTLANFIKRISALGFSRIHRSYAVNHHEIDSISYHASGDGELLLKSGQQLKLSRRYKEEFKKILS